MLGLFFNQPAPTWSPNTGAVSKEYLAVDVQGDDVFSRMTVGIEVSMHRRRTPPPAVSALCAQPVVH